MKGPPTSNKRTMGLDQGLGPLTAQTRAQPMTRNQT